MSATIWNISKQELRMGGNVLLKQLSFIHSIQRFSSRRSHANHTLLYITIVWDIAQLWCLYLCVMVVYVLECICVSTCDATIFNMCKKFANICSSAKLPQVWMYVCMLPLILVEYVTIRCFVFSASLVCSSSEFCTTHLNTHTWEHN